MAEELPAGWTVTTVVRYELRRGDPTTLIIFNIGRLGIGSSADMRNWLVAEGYRIDKEWWEQNDFYVIRIWGTISSLWFARRWGQPITTYYWPPPTPEEPEPPAQTTPPPPEPSPGPGPITTYPTDDTHQSICTTGTTGSRRMVGTT